MAAFLTAAIASGSDDEETGFDRAPKGPFAVLRPCAGMTRVRFKGFISVPFAQARSNRVSMACMTSGGALQ